MQIYEDECLQIFLEKQEQLFDQKVAATLEEADTFLEDSMAVVLDSVEEVQNYFEESGMDVSDMTLEEVAEASEVFSLSGGRYLVVEA